MGKGIEPTLGIQDSAAWESEHLSLHWSPRGEREAKEGTNHTRRIFAWIEPSLVVVMSVVLPRMNRHVKRLVLSECRASREDVAPIHAGLISYEYFDDGKQEEHFKANCPRN